MPDLHLSKDRQRSLWSQIREFSHVARDWLRKVRKKVRKALMIDEATAAQLTNDQIGMLNYHMRRAATDALVFGRSEFLGISFRRHREWQPRVETSSLHLIGSFPNLRPRPFAGTLRDQASPAGGRRDTA